MFRKHIKDLEAEAEDGLDWMNAVQDQIEFAKDGLIKAYHSLTGVDLSPVQDQVRARNVHTAGAVLEDARHVYIWKSTDDRIWYHAAGETTLYPADDDILWPWNTDELPRYLFSKDILSLFCTQPQITLKEIAALRLVCKQWRYWIDGNHTLWKQHVERITTLLPYAPETLPATYGLFNALQLPRDTKPFAKRPLQQRVRLLAGLYAPFRVREWIDLSDTREFDMVDIERSFRREYPPLKRHHSLLKWGFEIRFENYQGSEIPPLRVCAFGTISGVWVKWGTTSRKMKKAIQFATICDNYAKIALGVLNKGWIAQWKLKIK